MRVAALILGIIAGLYELVISGLVSTISVIGSAAEHSAFGPHPGGGPSNATMNMMVLLIYSIPLLAIVGGGVAMKAPQIGGLMMLASAAGLLWWLGANAFTIVPLACSGVGGALVFFGEKPDNDLQLGPPAPPQTERFQPPNRRPAVESGHRIEPSFSTEASAQLPLTKAEREQLPREEEQFKDIENEITDSSITVLRAAKADGWRVDYMRNSNRVGVSKPAEGTHYLFSNQAIMKFGMSKKYF